MAGLPFFIATLVFFVGFLFICWAFKDQAREDRARREERKKREVELIRENRPRGVYIHHTKNNHNTKDGD